MTLTNDERWLIARYCGFELKACDDPECKQPCDSWVILENGVCLCQEGDELGWLPEKPTVDAIVKEIDAVHGFNEDSAWWTLRMLEAMFDHGSAPWLIPCSRSEPGKWLVQVRRGNTLEHHYKPTIPEAVAVACLACAKEKFGERKAVLKRTTGTLQ